MSDFGLRRELEDAIDGEVRFDKVSRAPLPPPTVE
jgi:hypothetical protein